MLGSSRSCCVLLHLPCVFPSSIKSSSWSIKTLHLHHQPSSSSSPNLPANSALFSATFHREEHIFCSLGGGLNLAPLQPAIGASITTQDKFSACCFYLRLSTIRCPAIKTVHFQPSTTSRHHHTALGIISQHCMIIGYSNQSKYHSVRGVGGPERVIGTPSVCRLLSLSLSLSISISLHLSISFINLST